MLTKKFIVDFIGAGLNYERIHREINKQPAMNEEETRNYVKMELIDMLDRHDIEINNMDLFEERVTEIISAIAG